MTRILGTAPARLVAATALVALGAVAAPTLDAQPRPAAARGGTTAASGPAATIDRASRAFRAARTVRATFQQTLENPATGSRANAAGELVLAQPNKVALRFTQPAGDQIVSDGRALWAYLPSLTPGQVLRLPAGARDVLGGGDIGALLTAPRSRYDVSDAGAATIGGRATHAVTLVPKQPNGQIERATVWVDDRDGAVRQVSFVDPNGLVRTLRMTTWEPNAKVPASTFLFRVPEGVRVVDQASIGMR